MPNFSTASKSALASCDPRIQQVLNEAIKHYDFKVLEGHRSVAKQKELFAQGRTKPGKIVTHVDGVRTKSKHNYLPALAVDIVPYPVDWNNINRFFQLAGVILTIASQLNVPLSWGGNWTKLKDFPHFEL